MKKILILGSKGMLGQELVNVFRKNKKSEITAWDREEIDLADKKSLQEKILELKPTLILNAVAYNAVDKCEESEKEFAIAKKINGLAPGYLAEIARKIDAVFVHYSTDYVFGAEMPAIPEPSGCTGSCGSCSLHEDFEPEIGFREYDKPAPVNKYGESKLLGEHKVQEKGEKYYIIRLSKLFGRPAKSEGAKKVFLMLCWKPVKKTKK